MAGAVSRLKTAEARYIKELQARKAELTAELEAVERKLASLGARPKGRKQAQARKPRRRRGKPLRAYIKEALSKAAKPLKVRDIEQTVRGAGYKTQAKNFYHALYTALRQDPSVRKSGRGKFTLKKPREAQPKAEKK